MILMGFRYSRVAIERLYEGGHGRVCLGMLQIQPLNTRDIDNYLAHLTRHYGEPGFGELPAHPHSLYQMYDAEPLRPKLLQRWPCDHSAGSWEKVWGLFDQQTIIGHISLAHSASPALQHRIRLGMGIEQSYRGQGYGKQLLQTAVGWARQTDFLDWIDLDVFAHNTPAVALYKQFGFIIVGRVPDRFRVDEQKIEDWQMVLKLREPSMKEDRAL